MTVFSMLGLAGAMFVLAITPGPGVFATVARALASGFKNASFVVLGIVAGDLIFLLLAIYGLSAMAELLGGFFTLVKYLGGAYLIWLGYKIWTSKPNPTQVQGLVELSWKSNFFSGLAITLSNPKVILFYLGFLPTFVNLSALTHVDVMIVALIVSLVLGSVMLGYAYFATRTKSLFSDEENEKRMNRLAGGVMVSTGTLLVVKAS